MRGEEKKVVTKNQQTDRYRQTKKRTKIEKIAKKETR